MRIVVVGGCSEGVGKTQLISRLIEVLPGWGVLKTSPGHPEPTGSTPEAVHGLGGAFDVLTDLAALSRPGKDTARYLAAGASRVAWLRARPEHLARGVQEAVGRFADLPGLLVEGNSVAAFLAAHRLAVVARAAMSEVKPSALPLLARADWLVLNAPRGTSAQDIARTERGLRSLSATVPCVVADLADPEDPALAELLSGLSVWSRQPT